MPTRSERRCSGPWPSERTLRASISLPRSRPIWSDRATSGRVPSPLSATRYHSLVIERDSLPECLAVTAESEDGEIMGVRHKTLPIEGVQFHPEAILTEHGHRMLKNFLEAN